MNMNGTSPAMPLETGFQRTSGSQARLLVVDDDVVYGDATARALRTAGFEVFLAPDYRLALEDLESARPIDLLITDIVMPGRVNGVALSRMARMRRPDSRSFISRLRHPRSRGRGDWPRLAQADRRQSAGRQGQAHSGHRLTPERGSFPLFFHC
jgi:CheY-like chemotaxis protein